MSRYLLPVIASVGVATGTFLGLLAGKPADAPAMVTGTADASPVADAANAMDKRDAGFRDAAPIDDASNFDASPRQLDAASEQDAIASSKKPVLTLLIEPSSASRKAKVEINGKRFKSPWQVEIEEIDGKTQARVKVSARGYKRFKKTYDLAGADLGVTIKLRKRKRSRRSGGTIDL